MKPCIGFRGTRTILRKAGATQISAAVAQLRDVNLMSRTSSDTLQSVSIQLRDAVDSLETGIQRFHF